jgi:hypothetical protein
VKDFVEGVGCLLVEVVGLVGVDLVDDAFLLKVGSYLSQGVSTTCKPLK